MMTRDEIRVEIANLVVDGWTNRDIHARFKGDMVRSSIEKCIQKARKSNGIKCPNYRAPNANKVCLRKDTVKWEGPWPIVGVKPWGEPVFDVGGGHLVGADSIEALGFELPRDRLARVSKPS
jgi:hypothetical protein